MFFRKSIKSKRCVFCGNLTENYYAGNSGNRCGDFNRCKENLISAHVRKFPVSKNETFKYLSQFCECNVFLSSICDEMYKNTQQDQWHSRINVTGALLIGRTLQGLMHSESMAREFLDLGYHCKIPVDVALKFDDNLFSEGVRQKKFGELNFHGDYHANYGVMISSLKSKGPIRVSIDLFCSSEIEEKITTKIKYGLIVKNAYDAVGQMEERQKYWEDLRLSNEKGELARAQIDQLAMLDRIGLRGLNYSLTTMLKFNISSMSNAVQVDENIIHDFLSIDDWSLYSKI